MAHHRNRLRLDTATAASTSSPAISSHENNALSLPAAAALSDAHINDSNPHQHHREFENENHATEDAAQFKLRDRDAAALDIYQTNENSLGDVELTSRRRNTSISFHPTVTRDDGHEQPVEGPLAKMAVVALPQRHRGRSILQEMSFFDSDSPRHRNHSESDRSRYHPTTGELMTRNRARRQNQSWRVGESRHPLLQNTVDQLARDVYVMDQDQPPQMTSASTVSPEIEPVNTPQDFPEGYSLSPRVASSPTISKSLAQFGVFPSLPRPDSPRSRSYVFERKSSGRRIERRGTGRSINSSTSMSPASTFLSQWGREEPTENVQPDDEGQEIGDHSEYIIGRQIGYGGFSVVKEVFTIEQNKKIHRAVKIVRKVTQGRSEHENEKVQHEFEHEVSIWRHLKHPYILPLLAVYATPFATFCIIPLNAGGTLFDLIRSLRRQQSFSESLEMASPAPTAASQQPPRKGLPLHLVKRYTYQLASALRYLHEDLRIVHRDIKLENCLLDHSNTASSTTTNIAPGVLPSSDGGTLLLCDFGMADYISREDRDDADHQDPVPLSDASSTTSDSSEPHTIGPAATSTNVAGSLQYAAPELIRASGPLFTPAADVWAVGVLLFALLVGALPFTHTFMPKLQLMIQRGEWDEALLRDAVRDGAAAGSEDADAAAGSEDEDADAAVEAVRGCLRMAPAERWSVHDLLGCRLLRGCREACESVER